MGGESCNNYLALSNDLIHVRIDNLNNIGESENLTIENLIKEN
jgi:hypothetical protein